MQRAFKFNSSTQKFIIMRIIIEILLLNIVLLISHQSSAQKYEFNAREIYEVDGHTVSKIIYTPTVFEIDNDQVITFSYHAKNSAEILFAKFHVQSISNKETIKKEFGTFVNVKIYNVIQETDLSECVIVKATGVKDGIQKTIFFMWVHIDDKNPTTNEYYNFKVKYLNKE